MEEASRAEPLPPPHAGAAAPPTGRYRNPRPHGEKSSRTHGIGRDGRYYPRTYRRNIPPEVAAKLVEAEAMMRDSRVAYSNHEIARLCGLSYHRVASLRSNLPSTASTSV